MENVRIAILSNMDKVCAFMDNEAVDGLHYWDDELHRYLSGSTHTFSFKADATHEDSVHLTVGNKISFRYKMRDYYFNIVSCVRDEDIVEIEAFALIFELLNEYSGEYAAAKAMTFAQYIEAFDYEKTLTLGINEVSDKSIKYEWTGSNTILARLFSLANVFSAEIEILPQLNMDYSLNSLVLNVYREHSDQYQGIGANRTDKILRYGVDVEGITKTSDVTELYTSIKPVGKNGLTLVGMSKVEVDENGEQEYVLLNHDGIIRAVQARDRFPSNLMGKSNDGYILRNWSYETDNKNMLYGQALAQLKKDCVPQVNYEVKGYFDLGIGDTVVVCDEEFTPELYLSVRVVEQSISFTDSSNNKTTVGNVRELQSEIDPEILERVHQLETAMGAADNKYATKDNLENTNKNVSNVARKVSNLETVVAGKVSTEELDAQVAKLGYVTAKKIETEYVKADEFEATAGKFGYIKSKDADITYANIDFSNIKEAALEKLFSDTGIIKDLTIESGKVTGELVGVTIKGSIIEGETVAADKLVIKGEDGLYYRLNVNALGKTIVEADEKYQSGLDGAVLIKKSIVAEKINVDDLVAFGATIGGVHIGDDGIYSGSKASIDNTTAGFYLGNDGQFAFGDAENYLKLYEDGDNWKLAFSGELDGASGTFSGNVEAKSLIVGYYDAPEGEEDVWNSSYWLTANDGVISMNAHLGRDYASVSCSATESGIQSSSGGGGASSVKCNGGELEISASENLFLNGTDWDTFKSQHGYDWSTFETADNTSTWMPVANGGRMYHRDVAATFKQAKYWNDGTNRWTCLRLSNDIVLLFVKATVTTKVDITSAAAKGYASREYTCGFPITIKTILYANSYVENNYNWENVELKIHSISSTAIKSHFWCQNSYKGLPLWWYYMLVAQM